MNLLPLPINPEAFQAPCVRLSPVNGDNMEPTLRGGWDYVVCAPAASYEGEGLYLLDNGGFGVPQVFRCQPDCAGGVRLVNDNKRYPDHLVTLSQFAAMVLARVIADLKVRDEPRLRALAGRSA